MQQNTRSPELGRDPRTAPWAERFGFYWYNDREIFGYTEDDFERDAKRYAEVGINHIITFSCTHFRWSFRPWWDRINATIERIVRAFHRYDIAVTEHHSSHLTFNPLGPEDIEFMERVLRKRKSSIEAWPGLLEYADEDPSVGDSRLSSFRQIDGRTGDYARTSYHGYGMCFNHPGYRRAYLEYLGTVFDTGVDGIMTDDVQYFGLETWSKPGHSCACEDCRRLFRESTGFVLPDPGSEWDEWHGDYGSESFLAWIDFRYRSAEAFHIHVARFYEQRGLRLLRPNYVSTSLSTNPTAYVLDTLPRLDWVFQENCFSHVIRYSWPGWAVEAAYRSMLGTRRDIPVMSMFYPDRDDTLEFSWALAKSWGQLYLGTDEGNDDPAREGRLRKFEDEHRTAMEGPLRSGDVAIYDSRQNRMKGPRAASVTIPEQFMWAQSCYLASIPFTLVQYEDLAAGSAESLPAVVVANNLELVSDTEDAVLSELSRRGVTLIVTDEARSSWGGSDAPEFHIAPVGVTSAERWKDSAPQTGRLNLADDYYSTVASIASYIRTAVGDRWSVRFTGLPEGVIGTVFRAPGLPGYALHLLDTRGCLVPEHPDGVGHEDPVPYLGPVTLESARIEFNLNRPGTGLGQVTSVTAYGLRTPCVDLAFSIDPGASSYVIALSDLILDRYALIEVAIVG